MTMPALMKEIRTAPLSARAGDMHAAMATSTTMMVRRLDNFGSSCRGLAELLRENRRAALIMNALDAYPNPSRGREARLARQVADLSKLGCDCEELDLREFFGRSNLADKLSGYGLIWIHGGNSYVLKR